MDRDESRRSDCFISTEKLETREERRNPESKEENLASDKLEINESRDIPEETRAWTSFGYGKQGTGSSASRRLYRQSNPRGPRVSPSTEENEILIFKPRHDTISVISIEATVGRRTRDG